MKILDILNFLEKNKNNNTEIIDFIDKNKNDFQINNIDLSILYISDAIYFNDVSILDYFKNDEFLLFSIIDSKYIRILINDLEITNNINVEKFFSKLKENIVNNVYADATKNLLYNHELLNELKLDSIKIDNLKINKKIKLEYLGSFKYSYQLAEANYIFIDQIIITNLDNLNSLNNLILKITNEDNFFEFTDINIKLINKEQSISINKFKIVPNLLKLINNKNNLSTKINIQLIDDKNKIIFEDFKNIEINSYNKIIDFPNETFLSKLVLYKENKIADIAKLIKSQCIDKYNFKIDDIYKLKKSEIKIVLEQLLEIIKKYNLFYFNEEININEELTIKYPFEINNNDQLNSLEITLFVTSILESLGYNCFILYIKKAFYFGVFLNNFSFDEIVNNDINEFIENWINNDEIFLFNPVSFSVTSVENIYESKKSVIGLLPKSNTYINSFILDISSCRKENILPFNISLNSNGEIEVNKIDYSKNLKQIKLSEKENNKFDVWEKKLLDLSRRNTLINYKIKGKGLQIIYDNINELYSKFNIKKDEYKIILTDKFETVDFEYPNEIKSDYKNIENDFINKKLYALVKNDKQKLSLKSFYKERKKSFEETGSNIFYLAIGFIQYYESEKSLNPSYAPIILVPVDLNKINKDNYSLSGREEPPFLNLSIFEYFRQEEGVSFEDILNKDYFQNDEISIDEILNEIKEKLSVINRLKIIKACVISTFDFSKAVMWSDIKYNKNEIKSNRIIQSLINKKYTFDKVDKIEINNLDDILPNELATPLLCDSSQLEAIKASLLGKNFVLQGPPGTGKSQTITNIIVNAMYNNKTVLFVAEKKAALDVVYNRLKQLCLDSFVLEAHSNKSDKSSLMEQFVKRINLGKVINDDSEYYKVSSEIKNERSELNRIINLLHTKNNYFLSFYDAFVKYLEIESIENTFNLDLDYISKLDLKTFNENVFLLDQLYNSRLTNNALFKNPFCLYSNINYIPNKSKPEYLDQISAYNSCIKLFLTELSKFNSINNLNGKIDYDETKLLIKFINKEIDTSNIIVPLLKIDYYLIKEDVETIVESGIKLQTILENITSNFDLKILKIDYETNLLNLKNSKNLIKQKLSILNVLKAIKPYRKNNAKYTNNDLLNLLESIKKCNEISSNLSKKINKYNILFYYQGDFNIYKFNFIEFNNKLNYTLEFSKKYKNENDFSSTINLILKFQSLQIKNTYQVLEKYNELIEKENELIKTNNYTFKYRDLYKINYNDLSLQLDLIPSLIDYLPNWCSLLKLLSQCEKRKLNFIFDYLEKTDEINENFKDIYQKDVYCLIINECLKGDTNGSFNSINLKLHINHYKELINKYKELTIKETAYRISANMPSINEDSLASSQQGILNRAIMNKCKGKSIRELFSEIKDIITKIFPVFLMSPISTAQYLSSDFNKFDLVIFDEASQMPTSEAIGSIYRGKSLIVVGDSKQLPPTTFFQTKNITDNIDIDDQDSILLDLESIGIPIKSLNCHYRSKHESLIKFSNVKFYNNKLNTFPSPNDMVTKIKYINTNGVYEAKKAINKIEANYIIKEIERRLKDPELRKYSIGVVTFSNAQQEIIEDLLIDLFNKNKELEEFNNQCEEPIIVKNLENIQGDERDVILFSICYGPDKKGNMYYRFGPINNIGGERRLNVAISRSRYEMMIFASFDPYVLANMETNSIGAKELYNYLKYAKNQDNSIPISYEDVIENKIGFEKEVAELLTQRGYKVETNIGKSKFKVDLAIINPENENEYMLGILCDSYSYENAKTVKDRNIIQPNILEQLGWKIMRIYSFDFLDNKNKVIDEIVKEINLIINNPDFKNKNILKNQSMNIVYDSEVVQNISFVKNYEMYSKELNLSSLSATRENKALIMKEILNVEAPISFELLKSRYQKALGIKRVVESVLKEIDNLLNYIGAVKDDEFDTIFYWNEDQIKDIKYYRKNINKERTLFDVPKEEIIVAILEAIMNNGPIIVDDIYEYILKVFNIKMQIKNSKEYINKIIEYYTTKLVIKNEDNRIKIVK